MISFNDFKNIELVTAKVIDVKDHPNADKLYIVTIDTGSEKKDIVAGIKNFYTPDELKGKTIVVVNNLEPAIIRGIESNGMLLAASSADTLSVVTIEKDLPPGTRIK